LVYIINYFTFTTLLKPEPPKATNMNETENLTPQQSLELITTMINQAKGNLQRSSFHFLLWGWTIMIANLGVYALINFSAVTNPFLVFAITIPAAVVSIIYSVARRKKTGAPTHLDNINKWLWIGFGITCFIMAAFGRQTNWQINPIIITMCAVPTFLSGVMLRFKPLMFGGITFWICGIVSFLAPFEFQFLVGAIAVALGYLVPGYLLKKSDA
jgi:hypothetical protein